MRYEERVLHHSQEFGKIRLLSKRIGTVGKDKFFNKWKPLTPAIGKITQNVLDFKQCGFMSCFNNNNGHTFKKYLFAYDTAGKNYKHK